MSQNLLADAQAAASVGLATVTWIADLGFILQIVATVVAIIAGGAAAWYHIERGIVAHRGRKDGNRR